MNVLLVFIQGYLKYSLAIALMVMTCYEFALECLGLKAYVFYSPRFDFISANREGIVSGFGYLAICLIAIQLGRNIFAHLYVLDQKKSDVSSAEFLED